MRVDPTLNDISYVEADRFRGDKLRVAWKSDRRRVRVAYSHTRQPTGELVAARDPDIFCSDFNDQGDAYGTGFILIQPDYHRWYITVLNVTDRANEDFCSPGTAPHCQTQVWLGSLLEIAYAIEWGRFGQKARIVIDLRSLPDGERCPALCVQFDTGMPPHDATAGIQLAYFPAGSLHPGENHYDLPPWPGAGYVGLALANPQDRSIVTLTHPALSDAWLDGDREMALRWLDHAVSAGRVTVRQAENLLEPFKLPADERQHEIENLPWTSDGLLNSLVDPDTVERMRQWTARLLVQKASSQRQKREYIVDWLRDNALTAHSAHTTTIQTVMDTALMTWPEATPLLEWILNQPHLPGAIYARIWQHLLGSNPRQAFDQAVDWLHSTFADEALIALLDVLYGWAAQYLDEWLDLLQDVIEDPPVALTVRGRALRYMLESSGGQKRVLARWGSSSRLSPELWDIINETLRKTLLGSTELPEVQGLLRLLLICVNDKTRAADERLYALGLLDEWAQHAKPDIYAHLDQNPHQIVPPSDHEAWFYTVGGPAINALLEDSGLPLNETDLQRAARVAGRTGYACTVAPLLKRLLNGSSTTPPPEAVLKAGVKACRDTRTDQPEAIQFVIRYTRDHLHTSPQDALGAAQSLQKLCIMHDDELQLLRRLINDGLADKKLSPALHYELLQLAVTHRLWDLIPDLERLLGTRPDLQSYILEIWRSLPHPRLIQKFRSLARNNPDLLPEIRQRAIPFEPHFNLADRMIKNLSDLLQAEEERKYFGLYIKNIVNDIRPDFEDLLTPSTPEQAFRDVQQQHDKLVRQYARIWEESKILRQELAGWQRELRHIQQQSGSTALALHATQQKIDETKRLIEGLDKQIRALRKEQDKLARRPDESGLLAPRRASLEREIREKESALAEERDKLAELKGEKDLLERGTAPRGTASSYDQTRVQAEIAAREDRLKKVDRNDKILESRRGLLDRAFEQMLDRYEVLKDKNQDVKYFNQQDIELDKEWKTQYESIESYFREQCQRERLAASERLQAFRDQLPPLGGGLTPDAAPRPTTSPRTRPPAPG